MQQIQLDHVAMQEFCNQVRTHADILGQLQRLAVQTEATRTTSHAWLANFHGWTLKEIMQLQRQTQQQQEQHSQHLLRQAQTTAHQDRCHQQDLQRLHGQAELALQQLQQSRTNRANCKTTNNNCKNDCQ